MRASIISLAAGALCLPVTYRLTRDGSYEISILTIVAISILGTWLSLRSNVPHGSRPNWWALACAFAAGAVLSEALFFTYYYFNYGSTDAKLSVGIAISFIEAGVIALVGAATVIATYFTLWRITRRSSATP